MKVTDTSSINRQVVITLDDKEAETLYDILDKVSTQQNYDEKALADALMHLLGVPDAPTTLN